MKIFLSHKAEQDQGSAERVKEALERLEPRGKSKISVFVSTSDIAAADNWPRKIRQELKAADLLLLLYTDPNFDWAWCMFEAGLYEDLDNDPAEDNPITFLYHKRATPPSQLRENQGVRATEEGIERFLGWLVEQASGGGKLTPARKLRIATATATIVGEFPDSDRFYVTYTLSLDLRDCDATNGIPLDAQVRGTGSTMAVLGKQGAEGMTWGELTDRYRPADRPHASWLDQLDKAFLQAVDRQPCRMIRETITSHEGALILHPVLHLVDRVNGEPVQAEVAFIAEVAPADVGGPIFRMVRALERNDSELIKPFLQLTDGTPLLSDRATPELIRRRLELIGSDVGQAEVFADDRLRLFDEQSGEVGRLCRSWGATANRLERSSEAKRPNRATLARQLDEMRKINNELAKLVANRYAELVNRRE